MVRTWVIGVVMLVGVGGAAAAQTPQASPEPDAEQIRARQKIFMMEGVLERAVQLGVDNLRRKIRAVMPDDALLQGSSPQVRGFRLDGYGVFFDVEVPSLRRSLAWSLRTMNETGMALSRDLAQMRAFLQAIGDPRIRAEFDRTLQRIQRQMAPAPPAEARAAAPPAAAATTAQASTVSAQSLPVPPLPSSTPEPSGSADPLLTDPSDVYTQEVRAALVDAMIENSGALVLDAGEWLTVAARDNAPTDPAMSGEQMTLVLRIRGSDLSGYRAGRLTLEQARTRIEVAEH